MPVPVDLAVHRVLEQDDAEDAVAVEAGTGDDPSAHRVHQREHLVVARVLALVDAVELERLRRAAAALVEGGDEAGALLDLLVLVVVHGSPPFMKCSTERVVLPSSPYGIRTRAATLRGWCPRPLDERAELRSVTFSAHHYPACAGTPEPLTWSKPPQCDCRLRWPTGSRPAWSSWGARNRTLNNRSRICCVASYTTPHGACDRALGPGHDAVTECIPISR